jgi:hypothetical protein
MEGFEAPVEFSEALQASGRPGIGWPRVGLAPSLFGTYMYRPCEERAWGDGGADWGDGGRAWGDGGTARAGRCAPPCGARV